jgi:hypothetical protein
VDTDIQESLRQPNSQCTGGKRMSQGKVREYNGLGEVEAWAGIGNRSDLPRRSCFVGIGFPPG